MAVSSPDSSPRRGGRRPGDSGTRHAIAAAARAEFAEVGYEGATLRRIAAAAGVDPALIVHFFGSKEGLFREVMAMPPAIADAVASLADGPKKEIGRRLAELVVAALEAPETRAIVLGRIRSAATNPEAAALVREMVTGDIARLTGAITDDEPQLRANLVGMQLVGLVQCRHVVRIEPLASMRASDLVELLAPTFQRILTGPIAVRAGSPSP